MTVITTREPEHMAEWANPSDAEARAADLRRLHPAWRFVPFAIPMPAVGVYTHAIEALDEALNWRGFVTR